MPFEAFDPVVGSWRGVWDESAAFGVPAHVTIVFPFLDVDDLSPRVLADLAALFHAQPVVEVRFSDFGQFPGVLYLAPDDPKPFVAMTRAVVERWPEAPPYGGLLGPKPVPHLTRASTGDSSVIATITADVGVRLPIVAKVSEAWLVTFDRPRWTCQTRLTLGAARRGI